MTSVSDKREVTPKVRGDVCPRLKCAAAAQPIIAALSVQNFIGGNNTRKLRPFAATWRCCLNPLFAATPPPTAIVSKPKSIAQATALFVRLRATVS